MVNNNAPFGLRPVSQMNGQPYSGATRVYYVPATNTTALFIGDPLIVLDNSSDANGVPAVGIATAGAANYITGAMQGIANNAGQLTITVQRQTPVYLPALTAGYIYVSDDPFLLYEVQEDSVGGFLALGASSRNIALVAGAGNTTTGISGWQLQSSSIQTAASQMRIIQAKQEIDNQAGAANAKWLCKINQHSLLNPVGV